MSHYFAIFFLAAALAAAVWVSATQLSSGEKLGGLDRWRVATAIATLPILGVAAFLYREHLRGIARPLTHLSAFYYRPDSGESLLQYVVVATWNAFNLFAPVAIAPSGAILAFALCLAAFVGTLIYLSRLARRTRSVIRDLPLLFLVLLAAALLGASVKGAYPFGGDLRQQFILFPFLVLTAFSLLDRMFSWRPRLRRPLIAIVLLGVCLNSGLGLAQISANDGFKDMFAREMNLYHAAFPEGRAVYLDQFTLVAYFAYHDRWRWTSVDANTYEVTQGGGKVLVMRDERPRWNLDLLDGTLYEDLRRRLEFLRLGSTTVFSLRYPFPPEPWTSAERNAIRLEVPKLAERAHLETDRLILDGFNVFAQFRIRETAALSTK
jgi:hypothetical protein